MEASRTKRQGGQRGKDRVYRVMLNVVEKGAAATGCAGER